MGRAAMRAALLGTDAQQYAFWDGESGSEGVGTAADIVRWMSAGRPTRLVPSGELLPAPPPLLVTAAGRGPDRVAAMLVAELVGFERLDDEDLLRANEVVSGPLAAFDALGDVLVDRARWGPRLWAVVADVAPAATLALGLHDVMAGIDFSANGLPRLALRVLAHAGPVLELVDPLVGRATIVGSEVLQLTTLELRVPTGEVYATDAFASLLMLDAADKFACRYVGRVEASAAETPLPLYILRRTNGHLEASA